MHPSTAPTSDLGHPATLDPQGPPLDRDLLSIYLDDHHAGAVGGLELAKRAKASNPGGSLGRFLSELVRDLENDQEALRQLMGELGMRWKTPKAAAGWLAEKAGRLKLNGRLIEYSPLSRVVELEGLISGSRARASLFRTLAATMSEAQRVTYTLEQRAERALVHVEALDRFRVEASKEAFLQT